MAKIKTSEAARVLSRLGASKGGYARAKTLPPEQRKLIARRAANVRWAKKREKGV